MSEPDPERPSCACTEIKCIQRKCSCFRVRYYCSENCKCIGCRNTERYAAFVQERVEKILKRNPNAFDPKVPVVQEGAKKLSDIMCSCREIKCNDTNCECFEFMVGCFDICKCEECANRFGIKESGSIIKQDIRVNEIYGTGGLISEAINREIKMEEGTQPEPTSSSYPRMTGNFSIKSEQDDTGGITDEAINTENPTKSEDASSSDSNNRL